MRSHSSSVYAGNVAGYAAAHCETHDFDLSNLAVVTSSMLCPVGQIEQARDEAIAQITSFLAEVQEQELRGDE